MVKLKTNIQLMATDINIYWPESKYDGYYNIWILKPINRSRGFGVLLFKEIEKLFEHVMKHTENKYIVQKYVGE
jgi:glutathione synthase/RimK-type ligase-like ATP-grasp enzyme